MRPILHYIDRGKLATITLWIPMMHRLVTDGSSSVKSAELTILCIEKIFDNTDKICRHI
ncbi:UNVERIFIED_CONTAM: hypothetical protein FKN15_063769 [Acipenser sinensis]